MTSQENNPTRLSVYAVAPALLAVLLSSTAMAQQDTKTLTLDSRELSEMDIDVDAGFLTIQGVDGDKIEVKAEIYADSGDYKLSLVQRDGRAVLVSEVEPWAAIFLAESPRIDLTVKVPARMVLDIDDGSGNIKMQGMRANVEIDDGSGEVIVLDHVGNLEIDDSSGNINVSNVKGGVDIDDGSGEIEVTDVKGRVDVEDGSGSIQVANVVGDVQIEDGSGSMEVRDIDGHVRIRDGSGPITVAHVKKGLTIRESGSGGVNTQDIQGGVSGEID